jgi:hypothetical protein
MGGMLASALPAVKKGAAGTGEKIAGRSRRCYTLATCANLQPLIAIDGPSGRRQRGMPVTDEIRPVVDEAEQVAAERRAALKKIGRFVAISAPAVTLMLAAGSKSAKAVPCSPCVPSSRTFKTTDGGIDTTALLAAVAALPVETWRYKAETGLETRPHIGPYAEDFQAAFGVGDGVTINPIDAIGVCLAAIQALTQKVESLEVELQKAKQAKAA